jgi:hypothetical protein
MGRAATGTAATGRVAVIYGVFAGDKFVHVASYMVDVCNVFNAVQRTPTQKSSFFQYRGQQVSEHKPERGARTHRFCDKITSEMSNLVTMQDSHCCSELPTAHCWNALYSRQPLPRGW